MNNFAWPGLSPLHRTAMMMTKRIPLFERTCIMQLTVKGLQSSQHGQSDPSCRNRSHMHAFHIISALDAVGNVPVLLKDLQVTRKVAADESQDHHDHVLGHADRVAVRDFCHGNIGVTRGLQVDVVGTDACRDQQS